MPILLCSAASPLRVFMLVSRITSLVQRFLSVIRESLRLLRHLLKFVASSACSRVLLILFVLYGIAEYNLTVDVWYRTGEYLVWKAAFPWSWRVLFLALFVVPSFSFIQLLCLASCHLTPAWIWLRRKLQFRSHSGHSQDYSMLPHSDPVSLEEGEPSCASDDEGYSMDMGRADRRLAPRHTLARSLRFPFWFVVLSSSLWFGLHYQRPGDLRYLPLIEKANAHPQRTGYGNQEKIFIGAMFYNNEKVIPYWSDSIIKVIRYLGEDNVFVSILESESNDQSPVLLRQLDDRLGAMGVQRRILTHDTTLKKPENMEGIDRIYFLSALRNRILEPLVEEGGYDKVIFSNDVFIEPETILELLYTADGEYDMACGMDYDRWGLYDMWVLRDKRGRVASSLWPYFFDMEDYEAMISESPAPVFSCWNGVVVFNADPVLPIHLRSNRTLSNDPLPFALPPSHPAANDASLRGPSPALTPPLRFRASVPGECYSSECFLFPYDLRRLFNLQRIFANPRVIVAYKWQFYMYFKWFMRHPVLKWWIEKMYDGAWMQNAVVVVGDPRQVREWDGTDCFPWW